MSWNGSGSFNRLFSWVADKTAGLDISSTRMDADSNDIASNGFGNCLTRDGQGIATANLPMGGFKHTGVANGSSSTDYAAFGQLTNYQKDVGGVLVTSGSSTAYTVTTNEGMASPANGQWLTVQFHTANGTSATLAADSGSAIPLQLVPGVAVPANTIDANVPMRLTYSTSATAWILGGGGVSAFALSVNNGAVNNAGLANATAWTLKGNDTGSSAAPTDFTIAGLIQKTSPVSNDLVLGWDFAGSKMVNFQANTLGQTFNQPTVQRFTSGSGTYTATTGTVRVRVRMCAGGASGQAANGTGQGAGSNTSFGAWTTVGASTNAGGSGGATGAGTTIVRIAGGTAPGSIFLGASTSGQFMTPGTNPFGGAGQANTGAGGTGLTSGGNLGACGGAGEYVEFWATAAQASGSAYSVGAGGTGSGNAGSAGIIIVEELYT